MPTAAIVHEALLTEVRLGKFKAAFRPAPIRLGSFNVIIGKNGSGKSTLLEALQCLDTTIRRDAVAAFERYDGIHDVINVRTKPRKGPRSFTVGLTWAIGTQEESGGNLVYSVELAEAKDGAPLVRSEELTRERLNREERLITTAKLGDRAHAGKRVVMPDDPSRSRPAEERDRLALGWISSAAGQDPGTAGLAQFWEHAVFLRLSPNRLGAGSSSRASSLDPMLDEEGRTLPNLLNRLRPAQRRRLVDVISSMLEDITDVHVDETQGKRDEHISWALSEKHPTGQGGLGNKRIPAALLSEGTRRITAIAALLEHQPAPSLLCIEEIENGLDPTTTLKVLELLRKATTNGTQVIVTTHSPWLLDHVDWDDILRVERIKGESTYRRFRSEKSVKKFVDAGLPPGVAYVNEQ